MNNQPDARPSHRVVLVVEDDPDIRQGYVDLLSSEGYETLEAANGREALDLIPQMPRPCIILLDLMMPQMDGFQFLEVAGRDAVISAIPIVVVSAYSQHFPTLPGWVAGCLKKPVDPDALLAKVRAACG